ncbi:hypothetical protein B2M26_00705 [Ferroacidibacillus organovorans]|uniref:DUF2922 domain-containing protein n=2 Tax=Ferroacidibacillus organovorans TaxID=1765683 RepID=A0A1V4EXV5_9BACL|nr:hypothetical protein B2M26_00705 [Ferroacidibacillus organovorans]
MQTASQSFTIAPTRTLMLRRRRARLRVCFRRCHRCSPIRLSSWVMSTLSRCKESLRRERRQQALRQGHPSPERRLRSLPLQGQLWLRNPISQRGVRFMKEVLQLSFLTSASKAVHLQIQNPKQPVDPVAVNAAMDAIVGGDIFLFPTGRIVKKVAAKVNTSDTSILTLP